ncbi:MAG: 1-acyl-sn-glycerol-3-phosphate acyltransferase [Rhodobacteraceae bacterium]|nr:1-acyl-sn-glycerol-3-phosphate acyltransferase [Paracoccaceae bacterium]
MNTTKRKPGWLVLIKRLILVIYGPIAFMYIALAPIFCGRKNGFRNWYWRAARKQIQMLLWFLDIFVDIDAESQAKLSKNDGGLIIANHKSNLDVLALVSVIPDDRWVTFGAKIELTKIPFFKGGFKGSGILVVDRKNGKTALQSLIDGYSRADPRVSLVLFPEGTRVDGPALGKFKAGSMRIAQELEKSIQPICIFGAYELMPRRRVFSGTGCIKVRVLESFDVQVEVPVTNEMQRLQTYVADHYETLQDAT